MQMAVFAIMGVISLVVGLILLLVLPGLGYIALGIIGLGVVLIAAAAIIEFRRVRGAFTSKRGKFSTSTTILVSIFAGIILLTNAIGVWKYHRFDFTGLAKFTLTSQTKDVLKKLDQPVEAICFFVASKDTYNAGAYAVSLLIQYQGYTTKLIITPVDPDAHPETARKYNIQAYQTVVFVTKDDIRRVVDTEAIVAGQTDSLEHAFTSAIMEVTKQAQKKVYFLTGHGEVNPLSTDPSGYNDVRNGLLDHLYLVNGLDLVATPAIPADCAVLIIAGPNSPMTDGEKQIIASYLLNNGSVYFLTNPDSPEDIAQLLAPYGINVGKGTIVDPSSYTTPNKDSPMVPRNRDYLQLNTVYFPGATALVPASQIPQTIAQLPLVWTSPDAFMTMTYDPNANQKYNPDTDLKSSGGLVMAWLLTGAEIQQQNQDGTTTGTGQYYETPEIIVIGDSDFANNTNYVNGDNSTFFLQMVNYLTQNKSVVTIDRKVFQTRRLILTQEKATFLNISSIALLPAIVLVLGVVVWWQRRK